VDSIFAAREEIGPIVLMRTIAEVRIAHLWRAQQLPDARALTFPGRLLAVHGSVNP